MTTIQDRIIEKFREQFDRFPDDYYNGIVGKDGSRFSNTLSGLEELEEFILTSIKLVQEETRNETLEIIDTELEVKLNDGSEGTDYQEGWDDACLEWDLLLNTTIDKIKR